MTSFKWARRVGAMALVAALVAGCAPKAQNAGLVGTAGDYRPAGAAQPAAIQVVKRRDLPETRQVDWREHFSSIRKGAILVDLDGHRLYYWSPDATTYREFPVGVPRSDDLERTGLTSVVRRRENPTWSPTPAMRKRNPDLPAFIGPGPENPMGERALYLGWRYYAIHGTNNPSSIGERTTSGCIRLYPEHVEWLYEQVQVGTPVRVVDQL